MSSERRRPRPLIAAKAVYARFEKAIRALPIMWRFQSTGVTKAIPLKFRLLSIQFTSEAFETGREISVIEINANYPLSRQLHGFH